MHKPWVNTVDKVVISLGQTSYLNTSSTIGQLKNSQTTTLKRMLVAINAQFFVHFTQVKNGGRPVFLGNFYPLSPTPIRATKLNKGFIL